LRSSATARLLLLVVAIPLCLLALPDSAEAFPSCSSIWISCSYYESLYCPNGVMSLTPVGFCQDEYQYLYDYYIARCNGEFPMECNPHML